MKKCIKCGKENPADALMCCYCGERFPARETAVPSGGKILTFYPLPADKVLFAVEESKPKLSTFEDFEMDGTVLKKYNGNGGKVVIPDGVTEIGYKAFAECEALTGVTIPEGVTSIGSDAFYGCEALTSVTIPKGVMKIGNWAFGGCDALMRVTVPKSVTSIGEDAFINNGKLTLSVYPGTVGEMYAKRKYIQYESLPSAKTPKPSEPPESKPAPKMETETKPTPAEPPKPKPAPVKKHYGIIDKILDEYFEIFVVSIEFIIATAICFAVWRFLGYCIRDEGFRAFNLSSCFCLIVYSIGETVCIHFTRETSDFWFEAIVKFVVSNFVSFFICLIICGVTLGAIYHFFPS